MLPAIVRLLGEAFRNDALQRGRDFGRDFPDRHGLAFQHRGQRGDFGVAGKGTGTGQHFIEDTPEGKDVRARVYIFPLRLLGRHIEDGADGMAGQRERHFRGRAAGRTAQLSEAEVEQLHQAALGDHHVARLQVAMHDARFMRGGQCVGHLDGVLNHGPRRHPSLADGLANGFAGDAFHHDVIGAGLLPDLVHRHDIRMIQRGRGLGFAQESKARIFIDGAGRENLDGDGAMQDLIHRLIDNAHAARAERVLNGVVSQSAARRERGNHVDGFRFAGEQALDLEADRGIGAVFIEKPSLGNRFEGKGGLVQFFGGSVHP